MIAILERHGAAVYVDKKDESLPPTTSRETASILKNRIKQCRKFILLTTKNSKDSRWMPWELGLADGYRQTSNLTIFPGVDSAGDRTWSEREYLGIYDRIVFGEHQNYPRSIFMVWNQEKKYRDGIVRLAMEHPNSMAEEPTHALISMDWVLRSTPC